MRKAANGSLQRNKQRLHAARAQGDAHAASVATGKMEAVRDVERCFLCMFIYILVYMYFVFVLVMLRNVCVECFGWRAVVWWCRRNPF